MALPTAFIYDGQAKWSRKDDDKGHREYKLTLRVKTSDPSAGPQIVMTALDINGRPLPKPGSMWKVDNDLDAWAFCLPNPDIKPVVDDGPNVEWTVDYTFTTKGMDRTQYHDDGSLFPITSPLLEPADIDVEFAKYNEEATYDRFGVLIQNSAFEPIRGPQNEWDKNRATVTVKLNYPFNPLKTSYVDPDLGGITIDSVASMMDCLNDATLWDNAIRCVKLSACSAKKKYFGIKGIYWELTLKLDVRQPQIQLPFFGGFDRDVIDEATKVLKGHWGTLPGTGCLVDITAAGGVITAATVSSGGDDFPPSSTISLSVQQAGSGNNAVIKVTTDTFGIVNLGAATVTTGGTGYTTAAGLKTTAQTNGWVLENIGGQPPDPDNPSHFIRFPDRDGKNITGILNGHGLPTGTITSAGSPPGSGCTLNVTVTTGVVTEVTVAAGGSDYPANDIVILFIVGGDNNAQVACNTNASGVVTAVIIIMFGGAGYTAGVKATTQLGQAGRIHIEKYDEKNLLLLGIPSDLDQLDA